MKKIKSIFLLLFTFTTIFFSCGEKKFPGMKVLDRYLYTNDNEKVILRGINQMTIWVDIKGNTFKEIAKTGANSVRIVWLTSGIPEDLDNIITNCVKENMIPIVELHDATGKWSNLPVCINYWIKKEVIEVIKKHEKYLLINIANEAGDNNITPAEFEEGYKNAIIKMRKASIHVPLIIDSTDWGKDINMLQEKGFNLIKDDPDHNIMFSVHMWWPALWGYDEDRVKNEIQETIKMRLPLIVGEFGNKWDKTPAGKIPYLTIIEECEKNEIGYFAWSWGPGNNPQTWLDMTKNGNFDSLNDWGLEVAVTNKYSIKNTSKKPASFGGTIMPEQIPEPDIWEKNMKLINK